MKPKTFLRTDELIKPLVYKFYPCIILLIGGVVVTNIFTVKLINVHAN
jgi:hypothetical protein